MDLYFCMVLCQIKMCLLITNLVIPPHYLALRTGVLRLYININTVNVKQP